MSRRKEKTKASYSPSFQTQGLLGLLKSGDAFEIVVFIFVYIINSNYLENFKTECEIKDSKRLNSYFVNGSVGNLLNNNLKITKNVMKTSKKLSQISRIFHVVYVPH